LGPLPPAWREGIAIYGTCSVFGVEAEDYVAVIGNSGGIVSNTAEVVGNINMDATGNLIKVLVDQFDGVAKDIFHCLLPC
jgi:hypothetical protein